jgi:hypothetical protein
MTGANFLARKEGLGKNKALFVTTLSASDGLSYPGMPESQVSFIHGMIC